MIARAAALLLALGGVARAADCPPDGAAWVALESAGPPPLSDRLVALLRAQLADRSVAVCAAPDDASDATARVSLSPGAGGVAIEVRDRATDKLVRRDVALAALPPEARELALAIAIDELLRASWAELAIGARRPPPEPRVAAVAAPVEAPSPRRAGLGVRFGGDSYGGGQTHLGMDGRLVFAVTPRWIADAGVGVRRALEVSAPHGRVGASALTGALGISVALTPPASAGGAGLMARVAATRVTFSATPVTNAVASSGSATAVTPTAGATVWYWIGRAIRVNGELHGGRPVRGAFARDGGRAVTGVTSWSVHAAVGAEVFFQ